MATITAPVEGYDGEVGGVHFVNGVAETDAPAVIAYCLNAGYKVEYPESDEKTHEDASDVLPAGNASTEVWLAYALAHGTTPDELEGKGRDEIRELITNTKPAE